MRFWCNLSRLKNYLFTVKQEIIIVELNYTANTVVSKHGNLLRMVRFSLELLNKFASNIMKVLIDDLSKDITLLYWVDNFKWSLVILEYTRWWNRISLHVLIFTSSAGQADLKRHVFLKTHSQSSNHETNIGFARYNRLCNLVLVKLSVYPRSREVTSMRKVSYPSLYL